VIENSMSHGEIVEILEPAIPIIDSHIHLWEDREPRYGFDEFRVDIESGHKIVGAIFVECGMGYRRVGNERFFPIGESEWLIKVDPGSLIVKGVVAHADLMLSTDVDEVLEEHFRVLGSRFSGIRHTTFWESTGAVNWYSTIQPSMMLSSPFQEGVRSLARRDLVFDCFVSFSQLDEVYALAMAVPEARIVVNHLGGPIAVGAYSSVHDEAHSRWTQELKKLSEVPSVYLKLGGIGMSYYGHHWRDSDALPTSDDILRYWGPVLRECIEMFGPEKCMFESNFPVDGNGFPKNLRTLSYAQLWNAYKRVAGEYSNVERNQMLFNNAKNIYQLKEL